MKYLYVFLGLLVILMIIGAATTTDSVQTTERSIYEITALDAVSQYYMAERHGTPIDVCLQAGIAAASWLQAKDEAQYIKWKNVEAVKCEAAGVPR